MCKKCFIIPQFILEDLKLVNEGFVPSDTDLDRQFREKRENKRLNEGFINNRIAQAVENVIIYDSQNTLQQRKVEVMRNGKPVSTDADVNNANTFANATRNYFKNELNWKSIDDNGMDMIFNVHYSNRYANAFWDGDEMTFGDGDGVNFQSFTTSADVIAHELTHGVIQFTANLAYSAQPGALNEHFADVFGSVVKQYYKGQDEHSANWLIGDEIMAPKHAGRSIRSMKAPDSNIPLRPQPAHMKDYFTGSADNYGVHINSGIVNKVFYLVAMQLGTFKAAKLWFEGLKSLNANSQFIDLYHTLKAVLQPLVASNYLPGNTNTILDNAFQSVGII